MRIITVSREFGSGGREIGKRLADIMGMDYYDREILSAISEKTKLDEHYIENTLNDGLLFHFPLTFGRTFGYMPDETSTSSLLAQQHRIIREIAEKGRDFIIVGRSADVILKEFAPFNVFVYADQADKIRRCRERGEHPDATDKEIIRQLKRIDRSRSECHALVSGEKWGEKSGYHLCVNTSGTDIRSITPLVAEFARQYFVKNK